MNYTEALAYIHSVNWTFCKPGLERINALCDKLGDPQNSLHFVHVAGTNGKGSFCSMLSSVLHRAGLRVGLYTSPYIRFFNERMCVDGTPISDEELAELTEYIRPIADAMTDKPTEFELITAIAFEYFKRHACNVVILEAGMGGRLDSTNIIRHPLLSVITGIALDHTAYLGDTVEAIAAEKAGIIKDGAPVLYGGENRNAAAVIEKTAKEKGSRFVSVDYRGLRNICGDLGGTTFDFEQYEKIKIRLLGMYQPRNAAVVLKAVELLRAGGMEIPEQAVREGLAEARWKARFEVLTEDPLMIFDGAHNPQGIHSAVESIRYYFGDRKVYLLTGVLKDKDYTAIAADLSQVASRAFTITPDSPRALIASDYAETLSASGIVSQAYDSLSEGLSAARSAAKQDGVPLLCLGSLYVYSTLMEEIERSHLK
ncbi:MAG: bifunctional folylpolyglutamate synthase/dihydrofolate synthase [Ruminococcaceae bacterium]|nr:bifunctional folylpolyglutamate synthase/dihydrofolate synthase [Oscillospiraceae bacterium]